MTQHTDVVVVGAPFYNFTISSFRKAADGGAGSWIKHIFGQVRGGSDFQPGAAPDVSPLQRAVSEKIRKRSCAEFV